VYTKYGVKHYCVTNMPALVSQTSTYALSNAILPYVVLAADGRVDDTPALQKGINIDGGELRIALS
jgi:alanine dehydrogenase